MPEITPKRTKVSRLLVVKLRKARGAGQGGDEARRAGVARRLDEGFRNRGLIFADDVLPHSARATGASHRTHRQP